MINLYRQNERSHWSVFWLVAVFIAVFSQGVCASAQNVSGELSADKTILSVTVHENSVGKFDSSLFIDNLSTVTCFVKKGAGRLDVESQTDLSRYMGVITVEEGTYRCESQNALGCCSSDDAGPFVVKEGGAVEFSPLSGEVFQAGKKRFRVSGKGPKGDGAIIYSSVTDQTSGFALGSELYLTGDALLAVTSAVNVGIKNESFKIVCNGHFLTVRPYAGKVFQYNYANNPDPQGGGLIFENAVTQFRNSELYDTLGGGLDAGSVVITNGGSIQLVGSNGSFPWRLDVWEPGNRILTGGKINAGGMHTNVNVWTGTTHLHTGRVSVVLDSFDGNASAMSFKGQVRGDGGIYAYRKNNAIKDQDSQIHLFSPENDFTGGLTIRDTVLYLWANGALPAFGGTFTSTNATVKFMAKDVYHELPGALFSGTGYVSRAYGRWNGVVQKHGEGTLEYDALIDGSSLVVKEGKVRFGNVSGRGKYAGVFEGAVVYPKYSDASVTEAQNAYKQYASVMSNGWALGAGVMYDRAYKNFWAKDVALPEEVSIGMRVIVYSGYIWNDSPTNEVWTFAGSAGTWMYFSVNGDKIIDHSWKGNAVGLNTATIKPRANRFNLRIYCGDVAAGSGPNARSSIANADWTNTSFGFGYRKCKDVDHPDQADFLPFMDPGDGSLLTYRLPEESECPFPGSDNVVDVSSGCGAFESVICGLGTELAFSNGGYSVANLVGLPSITECAEFRIRDSWTLSADDIKNGGVLRCDGALAFDGGVKVSITDDMLVQAGEYLVAQTAAISGSPEIEDSCKKLWSVVVDGIGGSVTLRRKARGLYIRIR